MQPARASHPAGRLRDVTGLLISSGGGDRTPRSRDDAVPVSCIVKGRRSPLGCVRYGRRPAWNIWTDGRRRRRRGRRASAGARLTGLKRTRRPTSAGRVRGRRRRRRRRRPAVNNARFIRSRLRARPRPIIHSRPSVRAVNRPRLIAEKRIKLIRRAASRRRRSPS